MGNVTKPKILCVEDDTDACELITAVLPEFEVVSAKSKAAAIEQAKVGGFLIVLLDYHLPDGTGEDVCRAIRRFDSRTPILFITGTSTMSVTKAVAVGAQGLIRKARLDFVDFLRRQVDELTLGIKDHVDLSLEW